jgi:hypothetical protein
MLAFLMTCIVQTLRYDTPLHREVTIAINGQALVYGPADRAMIHYDIMAPATSQSVALMMIHLAITQSETHVANDIVRTDGNRIVCQTDTIARGCLTCHCGIGRKT